MSETSEARLARLEEHYALPPLPDPFVESLRLLDDDEPDEHRLRRLRRLRGTLARDIAATSDPAELEVEQRRLGIVDQAIRAYATSQAPEHYLAALQAEYANAQQQAEGLLSTSGAPGEPSQEEQARRIAKAKQRLPQIAEQIRQTKARLAELYDEAA